MSDNQLIQTITSERASAEYARMQALLAERNQSLHESEQLNETYKINAIHAHRNTRLLMAFCVVLILVMSLGGVA